MDWNSEQLQLEQIQYARNGELVDESMNVKLDIHQIIEKEYRKRLQEINETYGIIHDRQTGHAFEIAYVNKNQLQNGAILMPSTMFSSLTQNIGNAIEFAAHGAAAPNDARVYLAFPGNGMSDSLSRPDRQYFAHTSRFTRNGEAIESIAALARAFDQEGIPIKSISANVEAGRLGLGILAALPPNTVTSVYLNGLPGTSDKAFLGPMGRTDRKDQSKRREEDPREKYKVNDRTMREAKAALPNIYGHGLYGRTEHFFQLLSIYLRAMPNMQTGVHAFEQHHDLQFADTHAALQDTLAALKRQNRTEITFQFGKLSLLHDINECKQFGKKVAEELAKSSHQCSIQLLIDPRGSLDEHTHAPSKRWAEEKYALKLE